MSKTKPNIREKMAQLDELLAWFDSDDFELEAAAAKFAEAEQLAQAIEQDLMEIKNTVTVVSQRFDQESE